MPAVSLISQLLVWLWGFSQGKCSQGPPRIHRTGLEPGYIAGASLAINVPFNEKCELGAGPDVRGISERAAQVE